jgi:hypothetical protein
MRSEPGRPLAAELRPLVRLFRILPENDAYFLRKACEVHMKKSHSITLTVVAAMGMAARAQQAAQQPATAPGPPATLQPCEERRKAAQAAGTPFTENCGATTAHGTSRGGFGATGEGHSGGG